MEQVGSIQLIQNFEDILINVNEYCEAVNEKIEVIEEIVVDLRADLGKARELTTCFHITIKQLKLNSSKMDLKKVQSELSELSFRSNQGNASHPLSEEEKEKQQLKAKLLASRSVIQKAGI